MHRDDEAEAVGMAVAMAYDTEEGSRTEDVAAENLGFDIPRFPLTPKSPAKSDSLATYRTKDSDICVFRLSTTKCQRTTRESDATVRWMCCSKSSARAGVRSLSQCYVS